MFVRICCSLAILAHTHRVNAVMRLNSILLAAAASTTDKPNVASSNPADGSRPMPKFDESSNCAICNSELGKRKMNPRHHCRFCGSSVCGKCSPSRVQLEGRKIPQRTCIACARIIPAANKVKDQLNWIVKKFQTSHSMESPSPAIVSRIFQQSELSLAKKGLACRLSNVLYVMAANVRGKVRFGSLPCRFQEASTCRICRNALGKRRLNPRHHCRFCGSSVCGSCSPSRVWLNAQTGVQRACNRCAYIIPIAHDVQERLEMARESMCAPINGDLPSRRLGRIVEEAAAFEFEQDAYLGEMEAAEENEVYLELDAFLVKEGVEQEGEPRYTEVFALKGA